MATVRTLIKLLLSRPDDCGTPSTLQYCSSLCCFAHPGNPVVVVVVTAVVVVITGVVVVVVVTTAVVVAITGVACVHIHTSISLQHASKCNAAYVVESGW